MITGALYKDNVTGMVMKLEHIDNHVVRFQDTSGPGRPSFTREYAESLIESKSIDLLISAEDTNITVTPNQVVIIKNGI